MRMAGGQMMVRIVLDIFVQRNKTQQSFAISAVTEGPMIHDVAELHCSSATDSAYLG